MLLGVLAGLCAILALPGMASAAGTGAISGQITDASTGSPLPFAEACAYDAATFELEECGFADFAGNYVIEELEGGSYKVEFSNGESYFSQWFNQKESFVTADPIAVSEGVTTPNVNAALKPRYGKITGTATDATNGAGVAGIEVCAYNSGEGYFGDCERTDSSGNYTLEFLGAGSYTVEFYSPFKYNEGLEKSELEGPNYVTQYYNGKLHRQEADAVTVGEGAVVSGINAALQPGSTISGTVTDAMTGAALQGIYVCAWGAVDRRCNETGTDGNYAIPALPADTYKVEFQPDYFFVKASEYEKEHWLRTDFPVVDYLRQYWNEKFSFEAAEPVVTTVGSTAGSINARMTKEVQPPPPPGTAKLARKPKVKGNKVLLRLKCSGPGDCSGVVKLTATVATKNKKKGGKRNHKRSRKVLIGKKKFLVHAGKTATVRVKLNGRGRSLLSKAGGKGLRTTVSGKGIKKSTVKLKGKAKKKHRKKKHRKG